LVTQLEDVEEECRWSPCLVSCNVEEAIIEPPRDCELLFGPCMGFQAARKALRFGYESTHEWLDGPGAALLRRLEE
jgi:hypothetical protein